MMVDYCYQEHVSRSRSPIFSHPCTRYLLCSSPAPNDGVSRDTDRQKLDGCGEERGEDILYPESWYVTMECLPSHRCSFVHVLAALGAWVIVLTSPARSFWGV